MKLHRPLTLGTAVAAASLAAGSLIALPASAATTPAARVSDDQRGQGNGNAYGRDKDRPSKGDNGNGWGHGRPDDGSDLDDDGDVEDDPYTDDDRPVTEKARRTGPSSSQSPYQVPTVGGLSLTSILTVGDKARNGYTMAGIPDGLGAFDNGDSTFTLLMNHELGGTLGAVRAHGSAGAFVSRWVIDKESLRVRSGEDAIKRVKTWDATTKTWVTGTTAFNRFCSADLPDVSAFYNKRTGKGTKNRIFMNGEEAGAEGRAVATVITGKDAGSAYVLPWLGRTSFENVLAMPGESDTTVAIATDDSGGGQLYVYIGTKQSTGNDVEKAGLTNGKLYGVKIAGVSAETDATTVPAAGASFSLVEIPGAATMTGAQLEAASTALGISALARPEDGAWDPTNRGGFYVATTASFTGISRLWSLNFADPRNVLAGGTARIALAGPAFDPAKSNADQAGPRMMDNITVTRNGKVLVQEDPGNNDYVSGGFLVDPKTGSVQRITRHDPARFTPGATGFLTRDEESSGIIAAPFLGANRYLEVVQAHYPTGDATTVEGGQLLVIKLPGGSKP